MFDIIIVGARCAGSPTAMFLARRGFKVLLVDKASYRNENVGRIMASASNVESDRATI